MEHWRQHHQLPKTSVLHSMHYQLLNEGAVEAERSNKQWLCTCKCPGIAAAHSFELQQPCADLQQATLHVHGLSGYGQPDGCSAQSFAQYRKLGMPRQQQHAVKLIHSVYKPFNRGLHAPAEAWEASDDDGPDHVSDSDPDAEPDIMSDTEGEVVQERLRRARLEGQVEPYCIIAVEPGSDADSVRRHNSGKQSWWLMWVTDICQATSSQACRLSQRAGTAVAEGDTFYTGVWFEPDGYAVGRREPVCVQGDDTSDEVTQADIDAGIAGSVTFPSQLPVLVVNPEVEALPNGRMKIVDEQCKLLRYYRDIYWR